MGTSDLYPSEFDRASDGDRMHMALMAQGDASAIEKLYEHHSAAVFGLCIRIIGDRSEAEEILEEVFWQLWQHRKKYDPNRATPLAYLMTLARSRSIDRLRFKRLRSPVWRDSSEGPELEQVSLEKPSPLEDILLQERRTKVTECLAHLPDPHRKAITLSFFSGLTHQEIAERLGEPLGTIKTRIRKSLLVLREVLEKNRELIRGES